MENPPSFFYNPNAYELGIIVRQDIVCQCCGRARPFRYDGSFYSTNRVDTLCPWCIADGRAGMQYEGSFISDFEGLGPGPAASTATMSEESMGQVSCCTPGYSSWQGSVWLGHCGDACIFLGYVGSKELQPIWEEVRPDIIANDWHEADVLRCLHKDGDMTGYLFRCQHCGQHRLHVDAN